MRDCVHVTDLASAHLLALERLDEGSVTYNLGNGAGYSVLDVVRAVEQVSGRPVPRRAETGWTPRLADLVRTAYEWRLAHPHGYGDRDGGTRALGGQAALAAGREALPAAGPA